MPTATRDRILDAYRDLLVEQGSAAVSLEAVAARAGVSKGGLLYHFPSKPTLLGGLVERLREYTDANVRRAERDGAVATFLATSTPDAVEARAYWAVLVAMNADRSAAPEGTEETLRDVFDCWSDLLRAEVSDPVLADTIRLVGDGLYLATVTGLPLPSRKALKAVIARLRAAAAA